MRLGLNPAALPSVCSITRATSARKGCTASHTGLPRVSDAAVTKATKNILNWWSAMAWNGTDGARRGQEGGDGDWDCAWRARSTGCAVETPGFGRTAMAISAVGAERTMTGKKGDIPVPTPAGAIVA